jgi:hypothetical protein
MATLEGEDNNARDYYPPVPRVQEPELLNHKEQEDDYRPSGVLEVLQHVPQAHRPQRDEVVFRCPFSVVSVSLRTEN